jgi:hypothetical protein
MNESLENYIISVLFEMSKTQSFAFEKTNKNRFKSFETFILID